MVEVVFDDSVRGSMNQAIDYNEDNEFKRAWDFWSTEEDLSESEKIEQYEQEKKWLVGKSIGNKSVHKVIQIGFYLDMGDISDVLNSETQKVELLKLSGYRQSEISTLFEKQQEDIENLLAAAKKGEVIRIWRDKTATSACGFALVCDLLRDIECTISEIMLPDYRQLIDGRILDCMHWGELLPGELYQFTHLEKELPTSQKVEQSELWRNLKLENSTLRAVVNGRLMSVPEGFYDHLIESHLPEEEFRVAHLIGELIGEYPIGINSDWYLIRIQKMIADGNLELLEKVVQDGERYPRLDLLKLITQ